MSNSTITVTITIPSHIPEGRKSSVLKGIIAKTKDLMKKGTSDLAHIPEGHEREFQIGEEIAEQIERAVEGRVFRP
ncbi:hypothetical protein [Corallococcus carmarthensis]|uniref:Uncharacterized protein n=1 Tax=Corallococcus carmarthensis TaxID=2316728 RepID=A0A3A8KBM3_9BACT|nr:hypothetical protein [Corallococcus carmarthensis]RKG99213.1 hypothetical protein D7X32_27180 [Corallococcus carmarthensis]